MVLTITTAAEIDGRWIAAVEEIAGCLAYGGTPNAAVRGCKALALRILAEQVEHSEVDLEAIRFVREG